MTLHRLARPLCALPLALALGPSAFARPDLATLDMKPVELPRRDGSTVTVYRGTLTVPIVRAKPDSKPIAIDVWQFKGPESSVAPPIFQLNGGPGWPGMEPEQVDYDGEVAAMTRYQDLVVVGQRGIGTSTDTSCDGMMAPPDPDAPREERDAALQMGLLACREFWEGKGYDLSGLNVIEAAADVDDVRRLLGYERIVLWGGSFGSHWGMAVMRYHGGRVARAVLNGMEGPDHTYDMPSGVLRSLERMAAEAEVSSVLREHVPEGGLIAALRTVIERLEEEPAEVVIDGEVVRLEAEHVRDMALGVTGHVGSRRGAPNWPADIIALYRGDYSAAARRVLSARSGDGGLPTASFFMLDCGSGISPARLKTLQNDPAAYVVGDLGRWYQTACAAWDADLGADFRAGFTTDIPTVVVHGTWDVNTPFDNALECLPIFADHSFVIVEGGSHGAIGEAIRSSEEFGKELFEFLATGEREGLPEVVELPPMAWTPPRQSS